MLAADFRSLNSAVALAIAFCPTILCAAASALARNLGGRQGQHVSTATTNNSRVMQLSKWCLKHTVIMQYWTTYVVLLFLVFCNVSTQRKTTKKSPNTTSTQTLSRGWGDDITWVQTYEEGLAKMVESNKPLMVIHHLEDCPHCKALKKAFTEHQTIQQMAKSDFVMLNLVHETTDQNLAPDGFYVPRILFVDPSMTVRADIVGKYANRMYTYEPSDVDFLAENMMKAMVLLKDGHEKHDDL